MQISMKSIWGFIKTYKLSVVSSLVAVAAVSYFVTQRTGAENRISNDPAFSAYISAHTSGTITREGTIRIQLASAIHDTSNGGAPPENLFSFEPYIKGKLQWADESTLEFKPDKWLPTGTEFRATFHLDNLMDVPDKFSEFHFGFQTVKQALELNEPMMEAIDPQSLIYQRLSGELLTADVEESALIEKTLTATHKGKNVRIKWEHAADNRTHHFILDSLIREKKETLVKLSWEGSEAGMDAKGEKLIPIPALGDFKVMNALVVEGEEQYVSVRFSDPLLSNQNLDGLINMNISEDNNLKFIAEKNEIRVYPQQHLSGTYTLTAEQGILNILNYKMPKTFQVQLTFADVFPAVNMLGKGVIIPNSERLTLPFEAVSLKAVDVTIVKIFENNVDQFLQVNNLDGSNELKRVARPVARKTVQLDDNKLLDLHKPNRFAIDLSTMIKTEPGAIYNVTFSFKKSYSVYHCKNDTGAVEEDTEEDMASLEAKYEYDGANANEYDEYYDEGYDYPDDYNWHERDNPCSNSYYNHKRWQTRNVLASDFGIIAKCGTNEELFFAVTDLRSTSTISGISLEVYDYQKQLIGKTTTDGDGLARLKPTRKPYLLIAKSGNQRGYMRLDDGSSLSLSRFDVSGEQVEKGIKGFIYGERGVWRPGDSIYTMFMLDDRISPLPIGHPVTFELFTPQGQLFKRIVNNKPFNGFYTFHTSTTDEAPTGSWTAKVKAGGATFTKTIRIETVQPNRLKIKMDFNSPIVSKEDELNATLQSSWLHGAIARNLAASVEVSFSTTPTKFPKLDQYIFDDPSRYFSAESEKIFEGNLDDKGTAQVSHRFEVGESAPGMLSANILTKVFEQGGNYSMDRFTVPYSPYKIYYGIKTPEPRGQGSALETDTSHTISIVAVDENGNFIQGNRSVVVKLYKMDWRFWWDEGGNDLSSYAEASYRSAEQSDEVTLVNGKGQWKLRINYPAWGRYLLKVGGTDKDAHFTGKMMYIDWPSYYGRSPKEGANEAAFLSFTSNKPKYKVGEEATLTIPTGKDGRALISIESGSKIVQTHWTDVKEGQTRFTFKVTEAMLPNVFVNVSLLQPHAQSNNNLPIRMYGVIPIEVEDPANILTPVLKTPVSMRPEEPATFNVSEATGKAMTYTLAVVDEGLLDLTRFKTPDPHSHFYAREALGVKTWDMYDYVMGAFGVSMDRILAIGGDEGMNRKGGDKKANRFKPAIKFIGPFHLSSGSTNAHSITLPQYIGSVRVMVVAGEKGAYGFTEKAVPVKKPLMVLATLPRALGLREEVSLPVTVFALEKNIRNVLVTVESNKLIGINGAASKSISFNNTGDQIVNFNLRSKNLIGIGKVKITVSSGNEKSTYEVELDVRNPNPFINEIIEGSVAAGQSWNSSYKPIGIPGSNTVTLEVSSIPPINLDKRLSYLIHYPYGCVEQTTSSVFPQLALNDLLELSPQRKKEIEYNVKAGINRLKGFQQGDGGLSYWPGMSGTDDWCTSYAGHFMIEAQNKGYALPLNFLSSWKNYQRSASLTWTFNGYYHNDLVQAYRLYTLALARAPELGAMNRLKEQRNLTEASKWMLASAYILAGQRETAEQLINGLSLSIKEYCEYGYTYGSHLRDEGIMLETLSLLGQTNRAVDMMRRIAGRLSSDYWYSTQSTAYSLIAVSKFCSKTGTDKTLEFSYNTGNGQWQTVNTSGKVSQIKIPVTSLNASQVGIKNTSANQTIFTRIILHGQPEEGDMTDNYKNIGMAVRYLDMKGIELDPSLLEQGTEFMAEVTVSHPGTLTQNYEQMALSQVFPAGWEIHNTRMEGQALPKFASEPTYLDIRDDRVNTFFDLERNKFKTFYVLLNASYVGTYYLPSVTCEAMYNGNVYGRKGGSMVKVIPRQATASAKGN